MDIAIFVLSMCGIAMVMHEGLKGIIVAIERHTQEIRSALKEEFEKKG